MAAFLLIAIGAAAVVLLPSGEAGGTERSAKNVTFNKEVAPIFYQACAECHRPGEAAPFSVLSYKDVRGWAKSIKEKVITREMPPWHADPKIGHWSNDRRLTQSQIDTVVAWVDGGAKEGDPKDLPSGPQFIDGWSIGKPDVVIQMPDEYAIEANGPDEYQYFDVPTNFTEDKWIQMAEARPGNRKVVHHVIAMTVPRGSPTLNLVAKEQRDKAIEGALKDTPVFRDGLLIRMRPNQPVYNDGAEIPDKLRPFNDVDDFLTAYAPGSNYGEWQPGTAKRIPAGATIRFQVHYSKVSGKVEKDRSMVGLIFAKQPPDAMIRTKAIANSFFEIPPNSDHHKVTAIWKPKLDVSLKLLMPHMHYRGAAMEYKLLYPDGRSEILLNVPAYSFNWQTSYRPQTPIHVPAGSTILVTGYFDNTAKNKFNPDPAKAVRYGEPTYDEMMMGFVDYVVDKPSTLARVDAAVFDTYIGKYDFGNNRPYFITREGNRYFGQAPNNPKRELFATSATKFVIPEVESQVTFVKGDNGEVTELIYEQNERVVHCKRVKESPAPEGKQ
ncbi:MAG TPA: cytochrome c [Blastocatellia bacterium]|nr:cytochrome c [Blastocatellia bacterium]